MRRPSAITCLLLTTGVTATVQRRQQSEQTPLNSNNSPLPAVALNFTSPSPHIFASVFGLLQQWSNTFFPNGHTIVPCEVPKGTLLYHGRSGSLLPPSPEWLAFDIDMSFAITNRAPDNYMLTYRATKDVKCMYFDGTSASLFGDGSMDSQVRVPLAVSSLLTDHVPSRLDGLHSQQQR